MRISKADVGASSSLKSFTAEFERMGIGVENYEDVTGKSPPSLKAKLRTLIDYENWELVTTAYLAEKVAPLLGLL